jgi:cyanophycinase-like exopeptidase
VLAGIDEDTALVLEDGAWRVAGAGAVTVYSRGVEPVRYGAGDSPIGLPG